MTTNTTPTITLNEVDPAGSITTPWIYTASGRNNTRVFEVHGPRVRGVLSANVFASSEKIGVTIDFGPRAAANEYGREGYDYLSRRSAEEIEALRHSYPHMERSGDAWTPSPVSVSGRSYGDHNVRVTWVPEDGNAAFPSVLEQTRREIDGRTGWLRVEFNQFGTRITRAAFPHLEEIARAVFDEMISGKDLAEARVRTIERELESLASERDSLADRLQDLDTRIAEANDELGRAQTDVFNAS